MSNNQQKINEIQSRLDKLVEYQQFFFREINAIQNEIKELKKINIQENNPEIIDQNQSSPNDYQVPKTDPQIEIPPIYRESAGQSQQTTSGHSDTTKQYASTIFEIPTAEKKRSSAEEFIGKNLFSLVGIIITVIGVAIGAKYAIDHNLISPTTRIILGYVFAFGMFGVAIKLKPKYLNFSAILLSGSMAMMYFLTYFAYDFYQIISQSSAFVMMLIITVFTVVAAINYNRQIIAHLGLVGAYLIPFLVSENSGRIDILFGYITLINLGILAISIKKFWKPLFYTAFIPTWLIFSSWYLFKYSSQHFYLAFGFLCVFFITFYLTFVVYKLIAKKDFDIGTFGLVLTNSFVYFGFGLSILNGNSLTENILGLFAIGNSIIHLIFALVISRFQLGGKINLYLPVALSLLFLTISFPIQTKGDWTIFYWSAEAIILFSIARIKQIEIFEYFAYFVMIIASLALFSQWFEAAGNYNVILPFFNHNFAANLFFTISFGLICYVNYRWNNGFLDEDPRKFFAFAIQTVFLVSLYNLFRTEIGNYFHWQIIETKIQISSPIETTYRPEITNSSLNYFNAVWQINYTMFFLAALSFFNIKSFKSSVYGYINLGFNTFLTAVFLTLGLFLISELRQNYLLQIDAEYFQRDFFHILIRYISYLFIGGLLFGCYKYCKQEFLQKYFSNLPVVFEVSFYFVLLWLLSSELLNLFDIFGFSHSYKLGLSFLWGIYSLALIILGIYQRKPYLRFMAIGLFAVTLAKLFLYDIAHLGTISKTFIFITLGIILLIISFLYNKFKNTIFDTEVSK